MENQIEFFTNAIQELDPGISIVSMDNALIFQNENFVLVEKTCRRDRDYLIILAGLNTELLQLYQDWCYYHYDEDYLHDTGWNDDIFNYLNVVNKCNELEEHLRRSMLPYILNLLRTKNNEIIQQEIDEAIQAKALRDEEVNKLRAEREAWQTWLKEFAPTRKVIFEKIKRTWDWHTPDMG
ncbi:MAG TPA: hypothetical protein PLQ93_10720 [Bacteroidia bacterium]|nr:hypothetical protein [Bacteroidia bacterium]